MSDEFQSNYLRYVTAIYESPAMQSCLSAIDQVAGFHLTLEQRSSFLRYHAYITTNPEPAYITALRSGRLYHLHVNGILGHTQNALASVYYHLRNVSEMETSIAEAVDGSGVRDISDQFLVGAGGNTLALDFEYQAFVLSARRCLEYLTRALACYFKNNCGSFRKFGKFLATAQPALVSEALREAYNRHVGNLTFIVSASEKRSTRDKISHSEYISAGVVNITKAGLVLAGGGEGLRLKSVNDPPQLLRDVLKSHGNNIQCCIDDLLDTFVEAAAKHEKSA